MRCARFHKRGLGTRTGRIAHRGVLGVFETFNFSHSVTNYRTISRSTLSNRPFAISRTACARSKNSAVDGSVSMSCAVPFFVDILPRFQIGVMFTIGHLPLKKYPTYRPNPYGFRVAQRVCAYNVLCPTKC
jgi:hypothetical protein